MAINRPSLARTRAELVELADGRGVGTVALVPTMGALHRGHSALMDQARTRADRLVVSIFVNPLQFGPGEDLDRYPRTFEDDLLLCAEHGVDVVFAPSVDDVYPGGEPQVSVDPGPLGGVLEGAVRPGHFRGVLTVVMKLFGLVRPDIAVFGDKDYQQLVLIRRMVADLCLPVEVVGAETVREDDGLALSSRNRYLSPTERAAASAAVACARRRTCSGRSGSGRRTPRGQRGARRRTRGGPRLPDAHRSLARAGTAQRRGAIARRRTSRHHPADRQRACRAGLMGQRGDVGNGTGSTDPLHPRETRRQSCCAR